MKLVIFGLTVSSSWGNGHATLWRGLIGSLTRRGHTVVFFERDVPYYSAHRDLTELPGGQLIFYADWRDVMHTAQAHLNEADVALVTSYCPDGAAASEAALASRASVKVFYDLDTPITIIRLRAGQDVAYLPERGLRDFDLVLSYTGGAALDELQARLGARRTAPLYGSVDPGVHQPAARLPEFRADLSYLGTYAEDRQSALEQMFIESARRLPDHRFLIGGAQYPVAFPWAENIFFVRHVPPPLHASFYCSSRLTLNVTRRAMAEMGYCPSGRLFEAAACCVPVLSDWWQGLDQFFTPGSEILIARKTDDAIAALHLSDAELARVANSARQRALDEHTADRRIEDLFAALDSVGYITNPLQGGAAAGRETHRAGGEA
jgi:spore maturation protein CgeB